MCFCDRLQVTKSLIGQYWSELLVQTLEAKYKEMRYGSKLLHSAVTLTQMKMISPRLKQLFVQAATL